MALLDLMNAIAQMEGWGKPGTIATRNNNPGNLRWASNQIGQESTVNGKFATFATEEDGWQALQSYIEKDASNGLSVREFIYKYAPPSENNTQNYLNWLVSKTGLTAESALNELFGTSVSSDSGVSADSTGNDGFGVMPLVIGIGVAGLIYLVSK